MTALPQPGRLLTIAEYAALPEDEHHRWELLEGQLVMTPSPIARHNIATAELWLQLRNQLPAGYRCVLDVDFDLELASADLPGTSRRPDLIVIDERELRRVESEGGLLRASATLLVVEVMSPGTRRTDMYAKRADYADAGIPHYWIVDLDPPTSLIACHLTPDFGYQDSGTVTGRFDAREPFPFEIDLDALLA